METDGIVIATREVRATSRDSGGNLDKTEIGNEEAGPCAGTMLDWQANSVSICGDLSLTCTVQSSILMTGEHPIRRKNSTLVSLYQAVHALLMREMLLLGEGMTHRHNIPQEQQKTIQQNHMLGG